MAAPDAEPDSGKSPRESPLVIGDARGIAFGELSDELLADVQRWIESGTVPGGVAIQPPSVFRKGELFVKFIERSYSRMPLRVSRALRAARLHARLAWVPVPAPVLALDLGRDSPHEGLLVTRFIEGGHLADVRHDSAALHELGLFLARVHTRGVHHGDLHPRNLQWDGTRWFLLDLEGVRSPAHLVVAKRLALKQWARLLVNFGLIGQEEIMHEPFDVYLAQRPELGKPKRAWERVRRYTRALYRAREER